MKELKKRSFHRVPPRFWWDYSTTGVPRVIIQGDYPGGEELHSFSPLEDGDWDTCINKSENLIEDFNTGRKTPNWRN